MKYQPEKWSQLLHNRKIGLQVMGIPHVTKKTPVTSNRVRANDLSCLAAVPILHCPLRRRVIQMRK